ncbi:AraC family transcriptional regulator [uncultured Formosa sp.]|uniref:AraC family transcriptional regulator n=1 Tax=uncultured Formosa sp. TaxID=255435 RepID=UPI002630C5F9|nr:AraC family transcriptional regulator [uncultured Formosa sp.]
MFICTRGNIIIEVDNKEYTISKNNILVSAPSTTIYIKNVSENLKIDMLLFENNFLLKNVSDPFIVEKILLFQNDNYSLIFTDITATKNLINLFIYLKAKSEKQTKFTDEIIRTIIFNMLLEIAELSDQFNTGNPHANKSTSDLHLKFKELVAKHILEHKSVNFYCKKLNISNKYLIEIVKKSSEKTPHEIIDEILLKEAYILLGNTSLTISEISFKLQFNSVSAFGRFFKKHTTHSPTAYRQKEHLKA